jgi:tRNA(fMet)-specific endonuclease VapC
MKHPGRIQYLLDTNICIYVIQTKSSKVITRFKECDINEIGISTITMAEMEFGICGCIRIDEAMQGFLNFVTPLEIVDFTSADAHEYGKIRHHLKQIGKPIGGTDLMIAAQAISRDIILVTNTEKEFSRVPGIKIENWSK